MSRLNDKTALVTGAATGIGQAIARRFVAEGARMVLVDIAAEAVHAVAASLPGPAAGVVVGDVSEEETLRRAVQQATEEGGTLDVLVSNACAAVHRPADELDAVAWRRTLDVCLSSVFYGAKHALSFMRHQETGGAIINVGSVNAPVATPGMPAYTAAKGGVAALTRQLAVEYGPEGVRTNAVSPGFIATERVQHDVLSDPAEARATHESCPLRRAGTPKEVADAALFLASDASSFINGQVLVVDGGATAQWAPALVRPGLREKANLPPLRYDA